MLLEVGETIHRAKSGRLIVRLSQKIEPGETLLDSKGKKLGKVVELIGPTSRPYASVNPMSVRAGAAKSEKLFLNR